jgi:hypothetical protein
MRTIKVLFLAADPFRQNALSLPEEARRIEGRIRGSRERRIDFETAWAVRPSDLQTELLHHRPDVVHFSGHGTETKELILESDSGEPFPVGSRGLSSLFAQFSSHVRLVVLNACFSATEAQEMVEFVDFCVGMNAALGDEAAICFAGSFYEALASGTSIRTAFELGKTAMILQNIPEEHKPQLFSRAALGPLADATLTDMPADSLDSATPNSLQPPHRPKWWQTPTMIATIAAGGAIVAALIGVVTLLLHQGALSSSSGPISRTIPPISPKPLQCRYILIEPLVKENENGYRKIDFAFLKRDGEKYALTRDREQQREGNVLVLKAFEPGDYILSMTFNYETKASKSMPDWVADIAGVAGGSEVKLDDAHQYYLFQENADPRPPLGHINATSPESAAQFVARHHIDALSCEAAANGASWAPRSASASATLTIAADRVYDAIAKEPEFSGQPDDTSRRGAILSYLDDVAVEAAAAAKMWRDISVVQITGTLDPDGMSKILKDSGVSSPIDGGRLFVKLQGFYERLSRRLLNGKTPDWAVNLASGTTLLALPQDSSRGAYVEPLFQHISSGSLFLNSSNTQAAVQSLSGYATLLHREAESIRAIHDVLRK